MLRLCIFIVCLVPNIYSFPYQSKGTARTCGYASCPATKAGMLNVHLVPHSHDDVGWLKTVDQYYYGSKNNIQLGGVQYIIDSVVSELSKDPSRRFIYVETAFFWQWWEEQSDAMKAKVTDLVNSGQLEFIGGGWSMHDEAASHYQSIVDEFTWGHRKLNDTFGECGRPRIGWQIDPFGHARETASIMAHMGFDGLFFARLDHQDKNYRNATQTLELIWQASANQGDLSSIFTSVLFYFYKAPINFCFDIECNDEPIIDNIWSPDYNVDRRINEFIDYVNEQAACYTSGNTIIAMGGDFNYTQADTWYKNMDKLIKYVNEKQTTEGSKINLLYSTPSCYLKAVNAANKTWPTKTDDFFPYSSDPHAFWTGYYTSRPTSKFMERQGNNLLQVCKQLHVLAKQEETEWSQIANLREAMGMMQHHDAITGTEKQHVAEDYALRLHRAFTDCQSTIETDLNIIMKKIAGTENVPLASCLLSNISQCDISETNDRFVVTVYNPLSRAVSKYVRLAVKTGYNYSVTGPNGVIETIQMLPIPAEVQLIPGRTSTATQELVFKATELPPLGYKSYYVMNTPSSRINEIKPVEGLDKFTIGNDKLTAKLDPDTGLLKSVVVNGKNVDIDQNFYYYEGAVGNNAVPENRSSGAYVFRPLNNAPTVITNNATVYTYTGPLVDEVHQVFSPWVSQVIRTYHGEEYLELEWLVGPIPAREEYGKEIISKFSKTGWATNGYFYTDSNGREMLERRRNYRPTWTVSLEEPVAGNYYPVTTGIGLTNPADGTQLFVIPDRAQGGSSINDGELELMVHRRCLHDDFFGVGEALNEMAYSFPLVARGRHLVVFGSKTVTPTAIAQKRKLVHENTIMAPWVLLSPTTSTFAQWNSSYKTQWSGLSTPLPDNIHLLTVEPWRKDEILLRLEHPFESTDDPTLSQPSFVTLENIFSELVLTSPQETSLSGNQFVQQSSRLQWKYENNITPSTQNYDGRIDNQGRLNVGLTPMQMRTFVVKIV